jgi:phytoene dehydrogenase-like protein
MNDLALIIGAGVGGLTTGALLARRGWRVKILEQSSRVGGCCGTFSRSGFKFDIGATLFPNVPWSGLDLVSKDLGLVWNRIFVDPFSQICFPGHRIGLYRDPEVTLEEWSREFPARIHRINELLKSLNKINNRIRHRNLNKVSGQVFGTIKGLEQKRQRILLSLISSRYEKKSAQGLLNRVLKENGILAGFDLQTIFWGQTKFGMASLAYVSTVMGLPMNGGFCLKGGSDALCRLLSQYIRANGGEISLNSPVEKVMVRKRKTTGLLLKTGEILEGRCYISNTTPWSLYEDLLSEGFNRKRMIRRLSRLPYPSPIFALFLGVKEDSLPAQLGHKVFFLPDLVGDENQTGPLFIALAPKEDPDRAPEGYRAMSVFHYTSHKNWENRAEYAHNKQQMKGRVLRVLKRLIPFLDEGLCFCESATPLTYERFTSRPGGIVNGIPQNLAVIGNNALAESTCCRDLYLISDCNSPGLGVEGICQASLDLVDRICKRYE